MRGRATNLEVLFARRQEVHKEVHVGRRAVRRSGEEDEVGAHLETRRPRACRDFSPYVVPDFLERDPENEAQRTKQKTFHFISHHKDSETLTMYLQRCNKSQNHKAQETEKPLLISIDVMRCVVGDGF